MSGVAAVRAQHQITFRVGYVVERHGGKRLHEGHAVLGVKLVLQAAVMLQREQASIGFQATLQVRNKLLSAYKDIMSMPV